MEANASGAISASWTTIRDWAISHSAPPKWERGTISSIGRAIRYKGDPSGYLFAARLPKITTTRTAKPITQLLAPRRGAVRTIGQDLFLRPAPLMPAWHQWKHQRTDSPTFPERNGLPKGERLSTEESRCQATQSPQKTFGVSDIGTSVPRRAFRGAENHRYCV